MDDDDDGLFLIFACLTIAGVSFVLFMFLWLGD